MATSQYIGARYVPLFAEPIEWDKTQQYEPLTIVTNNGNSYTSRQFVPTGIDISNESFWALTANYNAQVEQYRKEVKAYDGRITTAQETADDAKTAAGNASAAVAEEKNRAETKESEIQSLAETNETDIAHLDAQMAATTGSELLTRITNEVNNRTNADAALETSINKETERAVSAEKSIETVNVALIGDSYTQVDSFYFDKLKSITSDNIKFTRFSVSSTGFVRETSFGDKTNIPNRLNDLVNGPTVYDYIIMYAGINDYNNTATLPYSASNQWGYITLSQETAAIKQTVDIIRNSNAGKSAQIIFLPNSMRITDVKRTSIETNDYSYWYHAVINSVANYKGLKVIPNAMSWLMFVGNEFKLDAGYSDDGVHPNSAGGYVIASNMASIINGTFTETSWACFDYTNSKNITINDESVDCSVASSLNFDGHSFILTTVITSSHNFGSDFTQNVDVSNFVKYFIKTGYYNFFSADTNLNGFYIDYISNNLIDNADTLVFKIPASKPSGSIISFKLIETVYLC